MTAKTPPTFLAHAQDDTVVTPENSRVFFEALQSHQVAPAYLPLPSGGHGLNGYQGPMWDAWQTKITGVALEAEDDPAGRQANPQPHCLDRRRRKTDLVPQWRDLTVRRHVLLVRYVSVDIAESDNVFAMCDQWFRGPQGERVSIDESCQLWLPLSFDPATETAEMLPVGRTVSSVDATIAIARGRCDHISQRKWRRRPPWGSFAIRETSGPSRPIQCVAFNVKRERLPSRPVFVPRHGVVAA